MACAPSTASSAPRAWASSAIPATGRTAPVVQATCEIATSRVPGDDRGVDGASVRSSSPPSPMSAMTRSTPSRSRTAVAAAPGRRRARADVGHDPVARRPVDRPGARCSSPRSSSGSGRPRPGPRGATAAIAARASSIRSRSSWKSSRLARPRRSSRSAFSAMAARGLRGQRPDRAGVQVDPGRCRGERLADGGEPVGLREEWGHHGPYDTADDVRRDAPARAPGHGEWLAEQPRSARRSASSTSAGDPTGPAARPRGGPHPGCRPRRLGADLIDP